MIDVSGSRGPTGMYAGLDAAQTSALAGRCLVPVRICSVRLTVFVREAPLPINERRLNVIVRVSHRITGRSISNLQQDDLLGTVVYKVVAVGIACLETHTHAGLQQ